ncbi:phage protein Gp36 family protein [Phenylobacterium sp.]|uniref:phage protein Gp36 family protein n=1 Tax=Phenylobacterium sp. TaxID=1871053 RepID=UPI0035B2EA56
MAYATVDQFVAAVSEAEAKALAPVVQPETGYDDVRIQDALDTASATLDTYFASRYATPLDPAPLTARDGAIALAREALDRNGRDHVKAAADRVRSWAKDVSRGVAVLAGGVVGEDVPAAETAGGVQHDGPARVFTTDRLGGFLGDC